MGALSTSAAHVAKRWLTVLRFEAEGAAGVGGAGPVDFVAPSVGASPVAMGYAPAAAVLGAPCLAAAIALSMASKMSNVDAWRDL